MKSTRFSISDAFAMPGLVAAVLLLFSVTAISAQTTLSEYKQRIRKSVAIVDSLRDNGSTATQEHQHKVAAARLSEIARLLHTSETIRAGETEFTANNWRILELLRRLTDESHQGDETQLLDSIASHLHAIDYELSLIDETKIGNTKDQDTKKLSEILSRPEFVSEASGGESWIDWLIRKFEEWVARLWPKGVSLPEAQPQSERGTYAFQILIYIAFGVIALFMAFKYGPILFERIRNRGDGRQKNRVILGEVIADDESASDLFAEAEAFASGGDLKAAIRKGYIALLCDLGDKRVIRIARHKTNQDYLREVRKNKDVYESASGLTESFEKHWYGFEETTNSDWEEFRAGYMKVVGLRNGI